MVLAAAMIVTLLFFCVAAGFFVRSLRKDMRGTAAASTKDTTGNKRP
jgi:hypothetical protein